MHAHTEGVSKQVKRGILKRAEKMAKTYTPLIEGVYIDETWPQDRYVCVVFLIAGNRQTRIRVENDTDDRWEDVYKTLSLPKKMPRRK